MNNRLTLSILPSGTTILKNKQSINNEVPNIQSNIISEKIQQPVNSLTIAPFQITIKRQNLVSPQPIDKSINKTTDSNLIPVEEKSIDNSIEKNSDIKDIDPSLIPKEYNDKPVFRKVKDSGIDRLPTKFNQITLDCGIKLPSLSCLITHSL